MPRIARVVGIGLAHHITQRGNYRNAIFKSDKDRVKYLSLLKEYSEKYKLSILCYCLMTNHIHLIVIPENEYSMAKVLNLVQMKYSQYFNNKMKQRGHLWQDRYYSCILDGNHLIAAAKYVERNPVRAKLIKKPWEWKWSSALSNIGEEEPLFNAKKLFECIDMKENEWKRILEIEDGLNFIQDIRKYTMAGRPLAVKDFIQSLEKRLKRKLILLPRGRPKIKVK
jgi:putative transposase